jgi:hypothetical protein
LVDKEVPVNLIQRWTRREKILLFFIILLATFLLAEWQPIQAANNRLRIFTTTELYNQADHAYRQGYPAYAAAYLFAYIQREPQDYIDNVQGHGDKVDRVFQTWIDEIQSNRAELRQVRNDVENCGQYPCSKKQAGVAGLGTSFAEVFPPDMVKVCEDAHYKGKCSFLPVGEYTRWRDLGVRNDSISSVMVGDDVKVLLCVHNLQLQSECIEFTYSDDNLTNNIVPGKNYSINDNVSTARVTYKSGRGQTLPSPP